MLRSLLREPLLHFVLLGVALFWLHGTLTPADSRKTITLSAADVAALRDDHRYRTGSDPSPADEAALIERFVDDEVLVREALALGLDRGDIIVRRRLLQKMEFLLEELHPVAEPSDAELEAHRVAHADRYRTPERIGLTHVFVSRDRQGAAAPAVAAALRTTLDAGADPAGLGDPFLRGRELRARSQQELTDVFGPAFAEAVMDLPLGVWSAPIPSSYGLHLVRVTERTDAELPALARIREAVRRDWVEERRRAAQRAAHEALRRTYDVRIERTAP